jgi:uncharacterized membrane protein
MADVPVEVVVAAFQDPNGASAALEQLKQAKKQGLIKIEDAAVLVKDADGKLRIKETGDMGGGKGAVIGGVVGGVIGLLAGPIGWAALGGAVIGGLAAKMSDGGFSDARLKQIGASLKPNSSAIIAVIDHTWVAEVERQMQQAGADTVTEAISADIAKQLEAGKDVAYTALGTAEGVALSRVAAGGDEVDASSVVATDQGVYLDHVQQKGDDVTVAAAVITDQGAVAVSAAGKVAADQLAAPAAAPEAAAEAAAPAAAAESAAPAADDKATK